MSDNHDESINKSLKLHEDTTVKKGLDWKKELREWAVSLIVALVAVFILRIFVFTVIKVEGPSMNDTFFTSDRLIVSIFDVKLWGFKRGDVIITRFPNSSDWYVKRAVAVSGDTLEMKGGVTYVNGEAVDEPYIEHPTPQNFGPITVPDGSFFAMGDNRLNSHDSRASDVGILPNSAVLGVGRFVMWPLNRLGMVPE